MLAAILIVSALNLVPLNDLGPAQYAWGYFGGLWEDGSNVVPADHLAAGLQRAAMIVPRDANGQPSPTGKIVFLTAGFGETARITDAFIDMARNDPRVDHQSVVMINAAHDGYDSDQWITPQSAANLNRIRDTLLTPAGVTEKQVQVAWVQMVTNFPYHPLPIQDADAYRLKGAIAAALRDLKTRYPNLRIAYLSSRVYGGYATTLWNPEPYAYESALSNRWVIMGQVELIRTGGPLSDTRIGPIDYRKEQVPWLAWGPYLWANGTMPRSDGLTWQADDFEADGEQLTAKGAQKGAQLLLHFLLTEPTASWFRSADAPARLRRVHH